MREAVRPTFHVALIVGAVVLLSGYGGDAIPDCTTAPELPSLEIVYRLEAGEESITPETRDRAMEIVCRRLQAIGASGGEVRALDARRIRVVLPQMGDVEKSRRAADRIGATGQLYFYDWEANLIGRERSIGGHPGRTPPVRALRRAKREWSAADRDVSRPANLRLILSGALPDAYGAVRLASGQEPRPRCSACSASVPRFYLFSRSPAHELIAGPVTRRSDLRGVAGGPGHRSHGIVRKVPAGTAIVSEQPVNSSGEAIAAAEPGWYALRDRLALTGADITEPEQSYGEFNEPIVTFGFTDSGREAFHEVTRRIAHRGRSQAVGLPGGRLRAFERSNHFAVVLDDELRLRPIVNFAENPDGIDGRTGAQISGGFANVQEAQEVVRVLEIGALPIRLALIRQRVPRRR